MFKAAILFIQVITLVKFQINLQIWPPMAPIFCGLWVWEKMGAIQNDKYIKYNKLERQIFGMTHVKIDTYRGSPTYTKITNMVPTTMAFGLCTCKWGIFALVGDPLQSH